MSTTNRYAVINTFVRDDCYDGRVISTHRTLDAAVAAECRCQPRERDAYLPTTIAFGVAAKGDWVTLGAGEEEYTAVDDYGEGLVYVRQIEQVS